MRARNLRVHIGQTAHDKRNERIRTMKIRFLPANQAWALCMGDSIISIDGQSVWATRADLEWTLRAKGIPL
jgi:hypothetical protein